MSFHDDKRTCTNCGAVQTGSSGKREWVPHPIGRCQPGERIKFSCRRELMQDSKATVKVPFHVAAKGEREITAWILGHPDAWENEEVTPRSDLVIEGTIHIERKTKP